MVEDSKRIPAEVLAMAERVGEFIEYWGFKHVEGKIWGIMFLSREPRDMTYLVEQLGLSKALVSMSVARLLQYNVIRPVHPDRQRYQAYEANPKVVEVIFGVLRSRERVMLSRIQSAAKKLSVLSDNTLAGAGYSTKRVAFLSRMVRVATIVLDSTLALKAWDLGILRKIAGERNDSK